MFRSFLITPFMLMGIVAMIIGNLFLFLSIRMQGIDTKAAFYMLHDLLEDAHSNLKGGK